MRPCSISLWSLFCLMVTNDRIDWARKINRQLKTRVYVWCIIHQSPGRSIERDVRHASVAKENKTAEGKGKRMPSRRRRGRHCCGPYNSQGNAPKMKRWARHTVNTSHMEVWVRLTEYKWVQPTVARTSDSDVTTKKRGSSRVQFAMCYVHSQKLSGAYVANLTQVCSVPFVYLPSRLFIKYVSGACVHTKEQTS